MDDLCWSKFLEWGLYFGAFGSSTHPTPHLHGGSWGCPNYKPFDWQLLGGEWHSSLWCTCNEFKRKDVELPLSSPSSPPQSFPVDEWRSLQGQMIYSRSAEWACDGQIQQMLRGTEWWQTASFWGHNKNEEGLWGVISRLVGFGVAQYCHCWSHAAAL